MGSRYPFPRTNTLAEHRSHPRSMNSCDGADGFVRCDDGRRLCDPIIYSAFRTAYPWGLNGTERKGRVAFAESKSSDIGNFRMAPFQ